MISKLNGSSLQYYIIMKIAILLIGLIRTYQKTYQTLFDHLINQYPEHQFDLFLTTWNIKGDVTKNKSIYQANCHNQSWVNLHDLVQEDELNLLKTVYQPKFFRVINYSQWKTQKQYVMDEFILRFDLEKQRNLVEQSLFSQYYLIKIAMEDLHQYLDQNRNTQYDLIIKTRFDLAYGPDQIDWNKMNQKVNQENNMISLKNWIPKGISDQVIIGNFNLMQKYSELYDKLPTLTEHDMNEIKLLTFYLPDIYIHYDKYNPNQIDFKRFYQEQYEQIKQNMLEYLEMAHEFLTPIIAERLLLYFLNQIQKIPVSFAPYINILLVREDHKLKADSMTYFKQESSSIKIPSTPNS